MCGFASTGRTTTNRGKKYSYYGYVANRAEKGTKADASRILPHRAPHASAPWLEDLVWSDVRRFLENPGETLERVREQLRDDRDTGELEKRREALAKRLAAKQTEKDRYVRLYAQEHISEAELETYLADLKNQTYNLRLLIESIEADLSQRREHKELTETTHAWLLTLKERIAEVEQDTDEAFRARRQLVRLLVEGITLGPRREDGRIEVRITYRFGPPEENYLADSVASGVQNSWEFCIPTTNTLTLTVVAVK